MAKVDARKVMKVGQARRLLDAATGAKLCFGEPVAQGDRTIIPVARVQGAGGYGFGRDEAGDGGGGGGGWLEARPAGFIEIGPGGASFEKIPDPDRVARTLKAAASGGAALLTGLAALRGLKSARTARRRPAGLLRR